MNYYNIFFIGTNSKINLNKNFKTIETQQIDGKGANLLTNRLGWTTDLPAASRGLGSILVSKGVALLCFFDDETSQEIVAVDLEDLCERWRDESDLTRLFGTDIYAFNLSSYTVNICDIRSVFGHFISSFSF